MLLPKKNCPQMKQKTEISDEIFSSNSTFSIPLQTAKDTYDLNNVVSRNYKTTQDQPFNQVTQSSHSIKSRFY